MKVFYSPYRLTPLRRVNRLSSLETKEGILLKAMLKDKVLFADYFPHLPLGDRPCEEFLSEFRFQDHGYDKKVFDLLLRDHEFQKLTPKRFLNHQLWDITKTLNADIIKYKILEPSDQGFMVPLKKGLKVRLDANALFSRASFMEFLKTIPEKFYPQIEYVEDPLFERDWSELKLPTARDFIDGSPYDFRIYKPNREFKPQEDKNCIYSSYLGGDIGRYHSYCELILQGDLALTHGIITEGSFEEEHPFHSGSLKEGFIAEKELVRKMYQGVYDLDWKLLCSM